MTDLERNENEQLFSDGTRELLEHWFRSRPQPILEMEKVVINADGHKKEDLFRFLVTGRKMWEEKN